MLQGKTCLSFCSLSPGAYVPRASGVSVYVQSMRGTLYFGVYVTDHKPDLVSAAHFCDITYEPETNGVVDQLKMETGYRPSPLLLGCLLALLWWPPSASSNTLCDDACNNNTELEICEPLPDPPGTVPLPVMAFFPCNTLFFRARSLIVAAQMATRAIFRNASILPGYRLELSFNNTMVHELIPC